MSTNTPPVAKSIDWYRNAFYGLVIIVLLVIIARQAGFSVTPISTTLAQPTVAPTTATVPTQAPAVSAPRVEVVVNPPASAPVAQPAAGAPAPPAAVPAEPAAVQPEPTVNVAIPEQVAPIADAVDQAMGGNPAAAPAYVPGMVLPTVVVAPVDPSGGDTELMNRALRNSGVDVVDQEAIACAMDVAYGGSGCATPVAAGGRP